MIIKSHAPSWFCGVGTGGTGKESDPAEPVYNIESSITLTRPLILQKVQASTKKIAIKACEPKQGWWSIEQHARTHTKQRHYQQRLPTYRKP